MAYQKFVLDFLSVSKPIVVDNFTPKESELESSNEVCIENTITDISLLTCKLGVLYGQDLNIKAKGLDNFKDWVGLIKSHLQVNALACIWFIKYLSTNQKLLFECLLGSGNETLRKDFSGIIGISLLKIAKIEEGYFNMDHKMQSLHNSKAFQLVPASATVRFIRILIEEGINRSRIHYQRFNDFYQLLCTFAMLGYREVAIFIKAEAIYNLIDFVSNTTKQLPKANKEIKYSRKEIFDPTTSRISYFKEPIRLLAILICSCYTKSMKYFGKTPSTALLPLEHLSEIKEEDAKLLFNDQWNFLDLEMHNSKDLTAILLHLSWEDPEISEKISAQIKKEINLTANKQIHFTEIIKILKEFLTIKDTLMETRNKIYFEYNFGGQTGCLNELLKIGFFRKEALLEYLTLIAEIISYEIIASVFQTFKPKMLWIPSWIMKNFQNDGPSGFILKQFDEFLNLKEDKSQIPPIEESQPLPKVQKAGGVLEPGHLNSNHSKICNEKKVEITSNNIDNPKNNSASKKDEIRKVP